MGELSKSREVYLRSIAASGDQDRRGVSDGEKIYVIAGTCCRPNGGVSRVRAQQSKPRPLPATTALRVTPGRVTSTCTIVTCHIETIFAGICLAFILACGGGKLGNTSRREAGLYCIDHSPNEQANSSPASTQ